MRGPQGGGGGRWRGPNGWRSTGSDTTAGRGAPVAAPAPGATRTGPIRTWRARACNSTACPAGPRAAPASDCRRGARTRGTVTSRTWTTGRANRHAAPREPGGEGRSGDSLAGNVRMVLDWRGDLPSLWLLPDKLVSSLCLPSLRQRIHGRAVADQTGRGTTTSQPSAVVPVTDTRSMPPSSARARGKRR